MSDGAQVGKRRRLPAERVRVQRESLVRASERLRSLAIECSSPLRRMAVPALRMVTPAVGGLALICVIAAELSIRFQWQEMRVLSWFLAAVLGACVLFIIGRHQLRADLDLSRERVVVGERANGRLLLTNVSTRRALPLTIELPVGGGRADFDLPTLAPGAEHEDLFAIPTTRRAVLQVGPISAVRGDPLGLLRRVQNLTEPQDLFVHPRTVRVEGSAAGFIRDLEGETTKKLSESDVSFHALRNYVPGDDRRYIHWKSSARTGTLMVRQFEETRRSHLVIAISTRAADYASDEEFETAVSIAGSLGVQSLTDKQALSSVTSTRPLLTLTGRKYLDQLSGIEFERNAPTLSEVARKLSRDVGGASVAMLICGSHVEPTEMRRARSFLSIDIRTVVVRSDPDEMTSVRTLGEVDVVSVAKLQDLSAVVRRLTR